MLNKLRLNKLRLKLRDREYQRQPGLTRIRENPGE